MEERKPLSDLTEEDVDRIRKRTAWIVISQTAVIFLLLIAVVILFFILVIKIGGEGNQCITNPLVYGAMKLQEVNKFEVLCRCDLLADRPSGVLWFDRERAWYEGSIISNDDRDEIEYEEIILNDSWFEK